MRAIERRRRGRILVPVLALAGLPGLAGGSIPEAPQQQWVARYNGPANSGDDATSLAVAPDGSTIFVTGTSAGSGNSLDYATAAYSSTTGAQLWVSRYNGPANSRDGATSLAVAPDGSKVFVTGFSYGSGSLNWDYATVAYASATGAQLWVARYNGPSNSGDDATSVMVAPDGSKVFVTGSSAGSGSSMDYATVAYSSATGAQLWAARYNGPANLRDDATSLAVAPDGSKVFVTGSSVAPGSSIDYATVAYSTATGAQLWVARYDNYDDITISLAVAPDGSKIFVTGSNSYVYSTVAYSSATGAQLWVASYNGSGSSYDYATSLAVAPDGSKVFVTGYSDSGSLNWDYATVAYSSETGAQLWVARYNGEVDSDFASSLAVAPDGSSVFVTGHSFSGSRYDYATVAYSSATGARVWLARYNGPGNTYDDFARSIAVAPDGSKVFVTGSSCPLCSSAVAGSGGPSDYATVAYRTTTCANGDNEAGPASGPLHDQVEPLAGPTAATYLHGVNCDVVVANGL